MSGAASQDLAPPGLRAKVLTVSDGVASGTRQDSGGTAVADLLEAHGFHVVEARTIPDGDREVAAALEVMASGFAGLIVTTGGTGFGPRDQTPEGTRSVLERDAPGLSEAMRLVSPLGRLSRGVAGTKQRALILNVPGSPKGAVECLEAILDVIPHALELLGGGRPH
ncbi:MAG: MogA/MoaB family molybdenum cofactor biosynthesis protein [Acidimicrobiales bacterium]|jgi:molybdenum cofactor synthesis domain-containing protein